VALTDNEPASAAGPSTPGVWYIDTSEPPAAIATIDRAINAAKAAGAEIIVLSAHWGPNMTTEPSPERQAVARAAASRGVRIVHGHSAHIVHGVEARSGGLILYDTGDFIDDYAVDPSLRNDWSFVFLVETEGSAVRSLRMVPVRLSFAQVHLASGEEARQMRARMMERCAALGTRATETSEGHLLVDIAGA
jgi:poly-gamma-glutamate synthesis protein (capsule biosynthesis protein)